MGAEKHEGLVSRRAFLGWAGATSAAAAAAGLGSAAPAAARRRKRLQVFKLDAEGRGYHCSDGGGDCRGCKACRRHAKYKLFPSEKAARDHKAHVGCRCGVVPAGKLRRKTWKELFGPPRNRKRDQVDLRDPKVKQVLADAGH
jgi:hypothetical protein